MRPVLKPKKKHANPATRVSFPPHVRAVGAYDSLSRRFIYALVDPRERDLIRYVGCSVNVWKRYQSHIWEARFPYDAHSSNVRKVLFIQQLLCEGVFPQMIEEVASGEDFAAREANWIEHYRSPDLTNFERPIPTDTFERIHQRPDAASFFRRSQ
jgi:hypothetical protein